MAKVSKKNRLQNGEKGNKNCPPSGKQSGGSQIKAIATLEFKSADDFIWHEINTAALNKPADRNRCRCGAIGCKYKNQLLHR